MTTILADVRLGLMVSDSSISDGDRVWTGRKVFRCKGSLIGFAGDVAESEAFIAWWRNGCADRAPRFSGSQALVLSIGGLIVFNGSITPENIKSGVEAIGSGGKAAICVYEALKWSEPARAVAIVCKHDSASRTPVRTYRL